MNTPQFDYQIELIKDIADGGTDVISIQNCINDYTKSGWRLISTSWSEIGKNAVSVAGFGVNSTIGQTILIFEKERERPVRLVKYEIAQCNVTEDIILKEILFSFGQTDTATLSVYSTSNNFHGIKCDIIFRDFFDDYFTIKDAYFIGFTKKNTVYLSSAPIPVCIPAHTKQSIKSINIKVTKYVVDNKLQNVDSFELVPNNGVTPCDNNCLDVNSILQQVELLKNAQEVYTFVCDFNINHRKLFANDFVAMLKETAEYERSHGLMRRSAVNAVERYLNSLG